MMPKTIWTTGRDYRGLLRIVSGIAINLQTKLCCEQGN